MPGTSLAVPETDEIARRGRRSRSTLFKVKVGRIKNNVITIKYWKGEEKLCNLSSSSFIQNGEATGTTSK